MKTKSAIAGALLAFVALSVVYLVVNETKSPAVGEDDSKTVVNKPQTPVDQPENDAVKVRAVVAYYFYGNVRCPTCRKIEAYTAESITSSFTNELSTGRLLWKTVNTDEPENEHFVKDYELTSRSVVLVETVDGKEAEWKNLADIWDLVEDKEKFREYIVDETRSFLKKGSL